MAKSPSELSKKPKLTIEQLDRVNGGSGNGAMSTFRSNGVKDYVLVKRLIKAQKKAKKFVLFSDQIGRRVYIADEEKETLKRGDAPLTFNRDNALKFIEGFDDGNAKKVFYAKIFAVSRLVFETKVI